MKKVIRVRCPVCGMLPDWENEYYPERPERNLKDKPEPFKLEIFKQEFGGRIPTGQYETPKAKPYLYIRKEKFRGKPKPIPKGKMNYINITDKNKKLYNKIKKFFKQKIEKIEL